MRNYTLLDLLNGYPTYPFKWYHLRAATSAVPGAAPTAMDLDRTTETVGELLPSSHLDWSNSN